MCQDTPHPEAGGTWVAKGRLMALEGSLALLIGDLQM